MFPDNKLLGQFDLVGIPPAPRGIPQIEVSFDIDANGIIHVGAKDLGTGKEQKIQLTSSQKLSTEEIEKMKKDAEAHADEDNKRREDAETINQADSLVFTSERLFKDFEGKVDAKELEEVKADIADIKSMLEAPTKDATALKRKMEAVNEKMQKLSTELYQKAAEEHQAHEGAHSEEKTESGEKIVDAEVVDKKEEKHAKKKHK